MHWIKQFVSWSENVGIISAESKTQWDLSKWSPCLRAALNLGNKIKFFYTKESLSVPLSQATGSLKQKKRSQNVRTVRILLKIHQLGIAETWTSTVQKCFSSHVTWFKIFFLNANLPMFVLDSRNKSVKRFSIFFFSK